ncbi:MAG: isocitrate lyase/phosphoenolpyruvate mutase family protein [Nitrospira sp.]|nr:isocitrate lyase/phosphoenolpyruvate mutase family protein [Nitrospira sp.]
MDKAKKLREMLNQPGMIVLAGAHNALSAKLVERAGFEAVWASGFEISAAWGVPDASFLTMSENLEVARQISDAVSIPVIADCDNGFGNAINVMRTVEEYEQAGIAGISIEDNIFPKRCSFYTGVQRELVPVEEHVGKIRAAKAAQKSSQFVVIARTEALIVGLGMEEALNRARSYAEAGADAILVHSKSKSFDELKNFSQLWRTDQETAKRRCPLVIAPTTFPSVTVPELEAASFKVVIFANHAVRASIKAMQETLTALRQKGTIQAVSQRIVPLEEVYDLMGVEELQARERQFLPMGQDMKAIIVAAGFEKQLLPLIQEKPKCLLDIKGKTILERQVEVLHRCGIQDIVVIRGYQKNKIHTPNLRYYDNDQYEETGELFSLFCAEKESEGPFIFLYSDILFEPEILEKLLRNRNDISLVVDRAWPDVFNTQSIRPAHPTDLVITRNPPRPGLRFHPLYNQDEEEDVLLKIGQQIDPQQAHGEFIGLARFSMAGAKLLREGYMASLTRYSQKPFHEAQNIRKAAFTDMIQELIVTGQQVACVNIYKGWMEVDTFEDYQKAWAHIKR